MGCMCGSVGNLWGWYLAVGDLDAETAASGSIPCGRRVCKAAREKLEAGRIS